MKKIIQIARLELALLFYSPIAWLLIMVFFVQIALAFVTTVSSVQHLLSFGFEFSHLTDKLYTSSVAMGTPYGIYYGILSSLYLYTPLLTMGIISRETSSGSIKLLYSSPVKLSEMIYGKFLAMVVFNLVIVGIMFMFYIFGVLFVDNFDFPHPLVAILAAFLLMCTYAAIGIFMSSLTSYQVVAAISTFVALAFFNYIGGFGQSLDYIRDLTYSLSMPNRAMRMVAGLLTSREVIYYLAIIGMFLAFTITKLEFARAARPFVYKAGRYLGILALTLVVTYLSSRQYLIGYYDATDTKVNTIVPATQEILSRMTEGPIEMTEYINALDYTYDRGAPKARLNSHDRWEPYLRFKSDIKLNWVYYYDLLAVPGMPYDNVNRKEMFLEQAKTLELDTAKFLKPTEIRKIIDLKGENNRIVVQLKYNDKTTFLRTFNDGEFWASEAEIAAALKRLLMTPPKIVFATDGYQRSMDKIGDRDYKMFLNTKESRKSLINQGFDIDSIAIEQQDIPTDIAVLVIADPKVAYSETALKRIETYLTAGGNLLIMGEPGKQVVINPVFEKLGIHMSNGTIVQQSRDYSYDLVTPLYTKEASQISDMLEKGIEEKNVVLMPSVGALSLVDSTQFKATSILKTDGRKSWIKQGTFVLDSAALVFEGQNGDIKGDFSTAYKLTRNVNGKEQRILVSADADFFSNKELTRSNLSGDNSTFTVSLFKWFSNDEFPIDLARPKDKDTTISINKTGVKIVKVIYYGVLPLSILLFGLMLLIRRKQK